ncbi:UNVERIFIED_CONTAM: hypothetical protein FKN15_000819 [Acipenser sinensis]
MDRNALAELLQALESRRDAEERRREERYTALIERPLILGYLSAHGTQCPAPQHQSPVTALHGTWSTRCTQCLVPTASTLVQERTVLQGTRNTYCIVLSAHSVRDARCMSAHGTWYNASAGMQCTRRLEHTVLDHCLRPSTTAHGSARYSVHTGLSTHSARGAWYYTGIQCCTVRGAQGTLLSSPR